ncbi:MAG: hypothetical protein II764_05185, partial [Bacteroidales bacterium]|nr:hypothetical protein [Bacteroidales bacterium]
MKLLRILIPAACILAVAGCSGKKGNPGAELSPRLRTFNSQGLPGPENSEWAQTILDRRIVVKDGIIQPWLNYDSMLVYSMNFLKRCELLDTPDGPKPAYLVTSKFNEDGTYPEGRNRNNQGGNAYFGMKLFRYYYPYFGDIDALRPVRDLLDRMADFLTPDDWAWPGMVRTQDNDNPDGIYLDERIETDKAAMAAIA